MTLSRWIRDYLFTPMAFAARRRPGLAPLWVVAAMAICGLWHGAQWTFVLWGVWHGLLLALNQTWLRRFFAAAAPSSSEPIPRALLRIAVTFILVSLGWALFRARSMEGAWAVWSAILFVKGGLHPGVLPVRSIGVVAVVFLLLLSAQAFRYVRERRSEAFENVESAIRALKPFLYVILYFAVVFFSALGTTPFMYFQF